LTSEDLCCSKFAATLNTAVPLDTNQTVDAIQRGIFRRMKTEERLHLALEMSESMRNVALAGLRSRRPDLDADGLSRELLRIMYGFVPRR
jgi:hypothetical protein